MLHVTMLCMLHIVAVLYVSCGSVAYDCWFVATCCKVEGRQSVERNASQERIGEKSSTRENVGGKTCHCQINQSLLYLFDLFDTPSVLVYK